MIPCNVKNISHFIQRWKSFWVCIKLELHILLKDQSYTKERKADIRILLFYLLNSSSYRHNLLVLLFMKFDNGFWECNSSCSPFVSSCKTWKNQNFQFWNYFSWCFTISSMWFWSIMEFVVVSIEHLRLACQCISCTDILVLQN